MFTELEAWGTDGQWTASLQIILDLHAGPPQHRVQKATQRLEGQPRTLYLSMTLSCPFFEWFATVSHQFIQNRGFRFILFDLQFPNQEPAAEEEDPLGLRRNCTPSKTNKIYAQVFLFLQGSGSGNIVNRKPPRGLMQFAPVPPLEVLTSALSRSFCWKRQNN